MTWTIAEANAILKDFKREAKTLNYDIDNDKDYIAACRIVTNASWNRCKYITGVNACDWDAFLDSIADKLEVLTNENYNY